MTQNRYKSIKTTTRINAFLRDKGYGTRRSVEEMVERGLVKINGKVAKLGDQVSSSDKVEVRGKSLASSKDYLYYAYNKPEGVSTLPDVGLKSIKDKIGDLGEILFPVGRLDVDSTGLIILTNDGRVTRKLLSPEMEQEKEYRVNVNRNIDNTLLRSLKSGLHIGAFHTKPAKVKKVSERVFDIILTEGKNRQIRRMCASLGYEVKKLERFRIASLTLRGLPPNAIRQLKGKELEEFLKSIDLK